MNRRRRRLRFVVFAIVDIVSAFRKASTKLDQAQRLAAASLRERKRPRAQVSFGAYLMPSHPSVWYDTKDPRCHARQRPAERHDGPDCEAAAPARAGTAHAWLVCPERPGPPAQVATDPKAASEIADGGIGGIDVALGEREELLLARAADRQLLPRKTPISHSRPSSFRCQVRAASSSSVVRPRLTLTGSPGSSGRRKSSGTVASQGGRSRLSSQPRSCGLVLREQWECSAVRRTRD